ncbi:neuroguidin-A [Caerostris darwini]|uniref:Neuroguidin-A n=1 Tax=Caerostris darwini TaxID=1538125 RepID=A0AAV4WVI0_9ARAC|nr:neuroguidin-A [Caerostris darwini]
MENQTEDNAINNEDVKETLKLVKELAPQAASVNDLIQNVIRKIKNDELPIEKGLSFLELRNHMFLNYAMNLTHVIKKKLLGDSIENSPTIERIVESRVVLEKMKPIHEKLKYQIDNSVTAPEHIDPSNPMRFRANPSNLMTQGEDDDDEVSEERKTESNVYVPPKISAAYFEGNDSLEARKKKILENEQKRALNSNVLNELRMEYDDGPEQIDSGIDPYKMKLSKKMEEYSRYEEEYMTRLPMTKKQKHEMRQLLTVSNIDLKFDDISALEKTTNDISLKKRSSGRKDKFAKKHGKKKGKKRKH